MKDIIELIQLSGLEVPAWIFIIALIGVVIYIVSRFFKKTLVPKVAEYVKIKGDIMEIPIIAQMILETAWKEIEDADYENLARVIIGSDFELIDKEDYNDLKKFLSSYNGLPERTKDRKYEDIVTIKDE
jgi:hypothetical protein